MKPRRCVHGAVSGKERKVHHHIVRREHLVNAGNADALLPSGGTGGKQAQCLCIDGIFPGSHRLLIAAVPDKAAVGILSFRSRCQQNPGRMHGAEQRIGNLRLHVRFQQKQLRAAVIHAFRNFLGRQTKVNRTEHHADFMTCQVRKDKLRAIVKLHHQDISLPHAGAQQGIGKAICLCIQLCICPGTAGFRIQKGCACAKPHHIPQKAVVPRIFCLKLRPEGIQGALGIILKPAFLDFL